MGSSQSSGPGSTPAPVKRFYSSWYIKRYGRTACSNCQGIFMPTREPNYNYQNDIFFCDTCGKNILKKRDNYSYNPVSSFKSIDSDFLLDNFYLSTTDDGQKLAIILQIALDVAAGKLHMCVRHQRKVSSICVNHKGSSTALVPSENSDVKFLEIEDMVGDCQSLCSACVGHSSCETMDPDEIMTHFKYCSISVPDLSMSIKKLVEALAEMKIVLVMFEFCLINILVRLIKLDRLTAEEKMSNIKLFKISKLGPNLKLEAKFETNWHYIMLAMANLKGLPREQAIQKMEVYWQRLAKEFEIVGAEVREMPKIVQRQIQSPEDMAKLEEIAQLTQKLAKLKSEMKKDD